VKRFRPGRVFAADLLLVVAMSGCAAGPRHATDSGSIGRSPAEQAKADAGVQPFTAADVSFMQGMIHHHAQAVVMARWASTHGASDDVKILASRIDVAQRDEIAFMVRWLRDRHLTAPDPDAMYQAAEHQVSMPGMSMPDTLMPGMLTSGQMVQLSGAAGREFDQLFLRFMIQHHRGALTMVDHLFSAQGAGQELYVFRFASDVSADQTTEIDRMRGMLAAHSTQPHRP
jgi:uncharacterized protein (DUF305 family)